MPIKRDVLPYLQERRKAARKLERDRRAKARAEKRELFRGAIDGLDRELRLQMKEAGGDQAKAAKAMHLTLPVFQQQIRNYRIDLKKFRPKDNLNVDSNLQPKP